MFHVRASYIDASYAAWCNVWLRYMGLRDIGVVYLDNAYGREMLEDSTCFGGARPQASGRRVTDGKNLSDVLAKEWATHPAVVS